MALKQDSVDFVVCPKHGNKIEDIAISKYWSSTLPPPPFPPHAHTLLQGEGQLGILTLNKKIRQGNALVFEVSVDVLKTPTRVKS